MLKIEKINKKISVYDINVDKNHNFYANDILVHNCQEITLPTSPMHDISDGKVHNAIAKVKTENIENFNKLLEVCNGVLPNFINKEVDLPYAIVDNEDDKTHQYFHVKVEDIHGDKESEVALCVLAAFNLGAIKSLDELEEMAEYAVRILDFVIEMQDYPVAAAKKMLKRRSIGVGVTNFAYWLAKNNLTYTDDKSLVEIDRLFEHVQYYLLKASNQLAREFGKCEYFDRTKYSKGLLPIDHYNKNVDTLVKRDYDLDWEGLRLDIVRDGLRNSTLTAQMPTESSAVVSNATNGIEAPRKLITTKKSKSGGPLPCVVPEINKLKNKYQFSYEFDNTAMNKVVSIIQKWFDQGISVNHYYDKRQYADNNIPLSEVAKDLLNFYKWGGKQIYYANSKDYKTDKLEDMITSDDKVSEPEMELEDPNIVGCEGGACHL